MALQTVKRALLAHEDSLVRAEPVDSEAIPVRSGSERPCRCLHLRPCRTNWLGRDFAVNAIGRICIFREPILFGLRDP